MKSGLVLPLVLAGMLATPTGAMADGGQGATVGALGGALVGSLSGPSKNRVENSLIGAVAGGLLGAAIANDRERQGHVVVHQALEYAPSYQTSTWIHPDTRVSYAVVPQPVRTIQGRVCREVEIQARIDARRETLTGLSCRDRSGQWRLVDQVEMASSHPAPAMVVARPAPGYVVVEPPRPIYYPAPVVIYRGSAYPHRHPGHGYPRYYDRDWRDRHWRHR
ncbi:MAG: glycine zipper 2TM domain-containing protein [Magnetococcales bacterium]|nr:glycine zipper 2TM domain-containing protein [Magnetococcales bacterium]